MTDEAIAAEAARLGDPVARATFLDATCGCDPDRRGRVERLLALITTATPADTPRVADPAATADVTRVSDGSRPSAVALDMPDLLEPPTRPDSLGRLEHYEVLAELGRGGFGVVLKAFDERLHREVAVKVLTPPFAHDPEARRWFLREARAAAGVHDHHVVGVHAVSDATAPYPYLVMEFVTGETLQRRIARTGPLAAADIAGIGAEVARGLAAAHDRGLIHRDIKPANVLLDRQSGLAKLTDCGLARTADELALTVAMRPGGIAGTPAYLSPEQARGEMLDARSDLFSLGSVLYAMCTGLPPFRGDTALEVIRRVLTEAPPPVDKVNPKVPAWLAAVVARLHARDPKDRFQTARAVVAALDAGPAALGPATHWRPEWRAQNAPERPPARSARSARFGCVFQLLAAAAGAAGAAYLLFR